MIEILGTSAGADHQVILAVEMLPGGVDTSEFEIVNLKVKRGLLNNDDFKKTAFFGGAIKSFEGRSRVAQGGQQIIHVLAVSRLNMFRQLDRCRRKARR